MMESLPAVNSRFRAGSSWSAFTPLRLYFSTSSLITYDTWNTLRYGSAEARLWSRPALNCSQHTHFLVHVSQQHANRQVSYSCIIITWRVSKWYKLTDTYANKNIHAKAYKRLTHSVITTWFDLAIRQNDQGTYCYPAIRPSPGNVAKSYNVFSSEQMLLWLHLSFMPSSELGICVMMHLRHA